MKYQKLTFEDISQKNILYYDKKVEEACFNICDSLKIDNMPGYDSGHYYELENGKFYKKTIDQKIKLTTQQRIFEDKLLEKFNSNRHNVLFVFKGEVLNGIVHYSDYNQTKVLQAIQDDVLTFERRMRQYLFLQNYRNKDLIDYFDYRIKKCKNKKNAEFLEVRLAAFKRKKTEMDALGEFQMFDLLDLLDFGNSAKSGKIFPATTIELNDKKYSQITLVTSLRNMAMHGKNPVEKDQETSVYSINSLRYLFTALKTLEYFTHQIENLINNQEDYKKSIMMDNQSKLNIIHKHHPKALNYFIRN